MAECLLYFLKKGEIKIGSDIENSDIVLSGIAAKHCLITNRCM